MVFLGIYKAAYDYSPQGEGELPIQEGDLLFVLEKSTEDDWWKAKKKASNADEDEPEGLIPNNYVEEATPAGKAKALYDYSRQTDEELSFSEDAILDVYDTSDPDWTLVGLNGEYGFVPANYIEVTSSPPLPVRPKAEPEPESEPEPEPEPTQPVLNLPPDSPVQSPAAALAGIIAQKSAASSGPTRIVVSPPPAAATPPALPVRQVQFTPEESEEESPPAPSLPQRPASGSVSPKPTRHVTIRAPDSPQAAPSPTFDTISSSVARDTRSEENHGLHSPTGFHLYNIHEMVSHMGKQKKMPMTLGINIPRGIIMISPEHSRDQREWTADKLTHYSIEGKHVFMELIRPSRSIDFHAGAKDTAQEIVSALGELAGAARAEGLREVLAASAGSGASMRKGQILYDFDAQGSDEVSVVRGDDVAILDDSKSDEWWMVRRLTNGKEGVVPSSYVEVTGMISLSPSTSGLNAGRSAVEQNRLEEERLARHASKSHRRRSGSDPRAAEPSQRSKRESRDPKSSQSKSKPDPSKVRTWTDRSGSFKVEAEFIGLRDNKIHLHKLNGVKIAVPVPKMSIEDLEYVERVTGVSLDEDKPLSDIKRRTTQRAKERAREQARQEAASRPKAGITVEQPKKSEYDWFDFFLQCGINPQICERYAQSFHSDNIGEENLPDITDGLLRTLGIKEGDILRIMKFLDNKFGRGAAKQTRNVSFGGTSVIEDGTTSSEMANGANGGLFSGLGGALKNNTRKGRPAPPVQTNDVVDPKTFEQKTDDSVKKPLPSDATATPLASVPAPEKKPVPGFDDDAWDIKPSKRTATPPVVSAPTTSAPSPSPAPAPAAVASAPSAAPAALVQAPPPTQAPTIGGSLAELSLLSPPLQPTSAPQPAPAQTQALPAAPAQPLQASGATPSLFDQIAKQPLPPAPQQLPTSIGQQSIAPPRQRPQAPQQVQQSGSLIAPPPPRASSAPNTVSAPSSFGPPPPLMPQLTGYPPPQLHTQPAPPGQSMQEITQQRIQQNFAPSIPIQPAGFGPQNPAFGQFPNGMAPQQTGVIPQQFQSPPFLGTQPTGAPFGNIPQPFQPLGAQPTGTPFANPPTQPFQPIGTQSTSIATSFTSSPPILNPNATGINALLPPALTPQRTGIPFGTPAPSFGQPPPPVPPIPQGPTLAPLVPQKTGPPPNVRFGVNAAAQKLTPQPTGRRANLAHATPQNPFGF